jgi:hypothetical protein
MGRIDSGSGAGGNGRISGWAVDPATGAVPELIVVMDDGRLAGLTLPSWPRRAVAEDIGLTPRNQRIGFDLAPRDSAGAGDVRVFAVFGDRAIELVPAAA